MTDILAIVKVLLNIDTDDQDTILSLFVDMTIQSILNYCNIKELPEGLYFVAARMAVKAYRENNAMLTATNPESTDIENAEVASVAEGNSTVSFDTSKGEAAINLEVLNILKSNIDDRISKLTELQRYKRLYR